MKRYHFWMLLALLCWVVGSCVAPAQSIPPITINQSADSVSPGHGVIYVNNYMVLKTGYGFIWGDNAAYKGGYVVASVQCAVNGILSPASGYYMVGDYYDAGTPGTDGTYVYVNQQSGQGKAVGKACPTSTAAYVAMRFKIGTFAYDNAFGIAGPMNTSQGAQKADPQGRTWTASCTPFAWPVPPSKVPGPIYCTWSIASGGPTPTPTITSAPPPPTQTPTPGSGSPTPTPKVVCICIPVTVPAPPATPGR